MRDQMKTDLYVKHYTQIYAKSKNFTNNELIIPIPFAYAKRNFYINHTIELYFCSKVRLLRGNSLSEMVKDLFTSSSEGRWTCELRQTDAFV